MDKIKKFNVTFTILIASLSALFIYSTAGFIVHFGSPFFQEVRLTTSVLSLLLIIFTASFLFKEKKKLLESSDEYYVPPIFLTVVVAVILVVCIVIVSFAVDSLFTNLHTGNWGC